MSDWQPLKIGDLGRVVTGKTPPTESAEYYDGDELFVSPKDLTWNSYYVDSTATRISEKALDKFKGQVIPRDTVMFTSLSFAFGKMGIASRSCITNQQINSIIVNDRHCARFVYYLLRAYEPYIFAYNSGIDTPIVPKSVFERIPVLVPCKTAQEKIASLLSAYDDLIANNQRRIALLESMAEEIYREWFVRMRFPGHEDTPKSGGLPVGWTLRALSDVATVNAHSIRRGAEPEFIAYLDISAVGTHSFEEPTAIRYQDAPGRARRLVRDGDIIWSSVRPGNKTYCLILNPPNNLVASTGFAVISPKPGTPFSYLSKAVTTQEFTDQMVAVAKGAAYPATSFDDFENAQIVWPSSGLLATFHQRTEPMLRQVALLRAQCRALAQQRDVLLPRLISGKLRVDALDIQFPPSMQPPPAEVA